MIGGKQVLENNSIYYHFELKNIIDSNLIQFNNLVSYVVSKYIEKKNVDSNFIFELGQVNGNSKLIKVFFKNIISVLLSGIIKFQMKIFPNTFDIKLFLTIIINIICQTDYNTYNLHDIKFADFVNSVLNLNKLEDIKIFISFMFFKIYDFYWNPNIK